MRPETARRTSIVYSSNTISSHRRCRRQRGRARARRVRCRSCSPTSPSRARSAHASSKSPNARVASTGSRGGLDRSTRRRSVVTRLVSFSFSRARPHRHLFPRRSRARVQRSLCFKRERYRHRSRAARFVDGVVVLCARDSSRHRRGETNRGVRFRNDARVAGGEPENENESTSAHEK